MTSWPEITKLIQESLPNRPDDLRRLSVLMRSVAGDDPPVAAHLTGQSPPGATGVVLDVAVVSKARLYSFTLLRDNSVMANVIGLREITAARIEGGSGKFVVTFWNHSENTLLFADAAQREENLRAFAQIVIQLTWPA
jgi:hypothetical protein